MHSDISWARKVQKIRDVMGHTSDEETGAFLGLSSHQAWRIRSGKMTSSPNKLTAKVIDAAYEKALKVE